MSTAFRVPGLGVRVGCRTRGLIREIRASPAADRIAQGSPDAARGEDSESTDFALNPGGSLNNGAVIGPGGPRPGG